MSGANARIDLRPDHLAVVRGILRRHVPNRKVLAFGSRATWSAKNYSDLDLAVLGEQPMSLSVVSALTEDFGESDLPFKVDVVDWAKIDDTFRDIIHREGVAVQVPGERSGAARRKSCSMVHDWPTVTIEDIAEKVAMGPFGSSIKVETFVPEGIPIISGQHLRGARVDDSPGYNFIAEEHAQRLANSNVQRGDIIFTHAGNIGQVAYIPNDSKYTRYVVSQRQFYMRCDRSFALPEFVAIYFKSPEGQHKLLADALQAGVPSIAQPVTYLRTIEIPLPPLPEQRAIAHLLETLDDKIALNRRMNETRDAITRALFKSWFVDFDPVRAKMEGRDTGLPRPLIDHFPDHFVDSEHGEIPEGWTLKPLGESFSLTMGQSPPGSTCNDHGEGLPFLQGRTDFGFRYPENRKYCTAPIRLAESGDTLVSVGAPVGDINMAWEKCCIGRGVAALRHKSGSSSFTYYSAWWLQKHIGMYEHTGTVSGTINRKRFETIPTLEPRSEPIEMFDTLSGPLDCQIRNSTSEIHALTELRDILLPKLISGEIRLRDAERMVEFAT